MSRRSSTGSESAGRVLHLDAFSGIAGNMFLGALLDLGLPRRALEADLAGLGVGFRLTVERVRRGALGALYLDVEVPGVRPSRARAAKAAGKAKRAHAAHDHGDHHGALVHAPPGHAHSHAPGRSYTEICRLLERAKLLAPVRGLRLRRRRRTSATG